MFLCTKILLYRPFIGACCIVKAIVVIISFDIPPPWHHQLKNSQHWHRFRKRQQVQLHRPPLPYHFYSAWYLQTPRLYGALGILSITDHCNLGKVLSTSRIPPSLGGGIAAGRSLFISPQRRTMVQVSRKEHCKVSTNSDAESTPNFRVGSRRHLTPSRKCTQNRSGHGLTSSPSNQWQHSARSPAQTS